jgi:hypothetical protein
MAGTLKSDGNLRRATLYIVLSALSFALAGPSSSCCRTRCSRQLSS